MTVTREEVELIITQIEAGDGYSVDKDFIIDLISQYQNVSREKTYELHEILTKHADTQNWSRRKLYTLVQSVLNGIHQNNAYSTEINDFLSNYLDGLEGFCAQATRLHGDPADDTELTLYARSHEWWRTDVFTSSH